MSAEPTTADRDTAHRVWNEALCNQGVPGWHYTDALAAAIAAAREEGRREADDLRQRVEALAADAVPAAELCGRGRTPTRVVKVNDLRAAVAPAQPAEGAQ